MDKKPDNQELYEVLGSILVKIPLENRKLEEIRKFCDKHGLELSKTKTLLPKITKRLTRSLPQLPFEGKNVKG